jgi:hypothetical protein
VLATGGGGSGLGAGLAIDVTDVSLEELLGGRGYEGGGSAGRREEVEEGGQEEGVEGVRWQKDVAREVADLDCEGQEVVIAKGGRGGQRQSAGQRQS